MSMSKETWTLCQGVFAFAICAICAVKKVKPWRIAVCIFFSSWGWTWIHLYQLAVAKQQATLSRLSNIPDSCQKQTWFSAFTNMLQGESEAAKCDAYYSALLVNPVLEATPIRALTEMLSVFVMRPLQLLGESLGIYYKTLLDPLPLVWKIPILFTGTIFLCFLFLLIFRYSITTPFGIMSIQPCSNKQPQSVKRKSSSSKAIKSDRKNSMFAVWMRKLMNKDNDETNRGELKNNSRDSNSRESPAATLPYPTGQQARDQELLFPTPNQ